MGETTEFMRLAGNELGLPVEALEDFYSMAATGNPLSVKTMKWITKKINELFPQIPLDVL